MSASINKYKLVSYLKPASRQAEAYRTLRTHIQLTSGQKSRQALLVTSALRHEGKTITAANLAVMYAQAGRKVLLIDADLRNPSLHHYFAAINSRGLAEMLPGIEGEDEPIIETIVPGLWLLSAGMSSAMSNELVGSERMGVLMERWRERFDILIVDAPPTLTVTDSLLLSAWCDGVIFVIRSGRTKRTESRQALDKLALAQADIVGVVLNKG